MIPIYVCDDELRFALRLKKIIQDQINIFAFDMGPVYLSSIPQILLDKIGERKGRAVYFLDIDFPGYENGFELAAKIRNLDPRGFIIFITAHGDFAIEAFRYRLETMDYIVKGNDAVLKNISSPAWGVLTSGCGMNPVKRAITIP